jgi:TrmH family RNA methyltransferase
METYRFEGDTPSIFTNKPSTRRMATPTARQLKEAAGLHRRKNRETSGCFLVEGWRSVSAAIDANAPVVHVYRSPALLIPDSDSSARLEHVEVFDISDREMARLSDVKSAPGIAAVVRIPNTALKARAERILYLDGVQDPGNVGTLIRTAAWLGMDTVAIGPESADPWSPKVTRSTMGGIWEVHIERVKDAAAWLDKGLADGVSVWIADMEGEDVGVWKPKNPCVLVIGSEAHGVSDAVRQRATGAVSIPGPAGRNGVESLNAAVAGGIIMSHWASR